MREKHRRHLLCQKSIVGTMFFYTEGSLEWNWNTDTNSWDYHLQKPPASFEMIYKERCVFIMCFHCPLQIEFLQFFWGKSAINCIRKRSNYLEQEASILLFVHTSQAKSIPNTGSEKRENPGSETSLLSYCAQGSFGWKYCKLSLPGQKRQSLHFQVIYGKGKLESLEFLGDGVFCWSCEHQWETFGWNSLVCSSEV